MRYRVLEGQRVFWPNGEVRAEAGQVFEAYDDHVSPRVRYTAKSYLRGQMTAIEPVLDAEVTAGQETPEELAGLRQALAAVEDRATFHVEQKSAPKED